MRDFMDYVQSAFYNSTDWNSEGSYSSLNSTADSLLHFPTPLGLRLTLSSLASPNFATSYQLGSIGVVDGSISYLYSSVPLRTHLTPQSDRVPLSSLLQSYRPLPKLPLHREKENQDAAAKRQPGSSPSYYYPLLSPEAASLLYGRLYLPESLLEALVIKRVSPALQLQLSSVSGQFLRNGGTLLGLAQYDVGRYSVEGLASSDGGLLGLRGVYNFGDDGEDMLPLGGAAAAATSVLGGGGGNNNDGGNTPSDGNASTNDNDAAPSPSSSTPPFPRDRIYGRFSTGGEIYYGTLNKSGGVSVGARFATLPAHRGTPLTATLTLNPLMGTVSATYAVVTGRSCSLATKFDFNVYSYESEWAVGMELWRKRWGRDTGGADSDSSNGDAAVSAERFVAGPDRSFQAKMEWRLDDERRSGVDNNINSNSHGNTDGIAKFVPLAVPAEPRTTTTTTTTSRPQERSFRAKMEWRLDNDDDDFNSPTVAAAELAPSIVAAAAAAAENSKDEEYAGVIKARLDQNLRIGVLWEGRAKSLLFSLGSGIDLRSLDSPFRTLGVEVQFSS